MYLNYFDDEKESVMRF